MKPTIPLFACLLLSAAPAHALSPSTIPTTIALQGKSKRPKIKPGVRYATTWEAAVEEAKLLKVPLVVHLHGFT